MIPEAIPEDRQWAPPSPRVGKDVEAPSSSRRRDIRVPEGIIGDDDFERWLRRKCFVPYWMLHVCLRAIETADVVQSGTGQANAVLMAVFVAALSTAAFASRKERRVRRASTSTAVHANSCRHAKTTSASSSACLFERRL